MSSSCKQGPAVAVLTGGSLDGPLLQDHRQTTCHIKQSCHRLTGKTILDKWVCSLSYPGPCPSTQFFRHNSQSNQSQSFTHWLMSKVICKSPQFHIKTTYNTIR